MDELMSIEKKAVIYSGKAKSLFATNDPDLVIVEFRDDTTAFDGVKHEKLADKGEINNHISTYIMQALAAAGVPTHFKEMISPTEAIVRRLTMIPLENVIRNITAGGLCRRLGVTPGMKLNPPLYELFLKSDELHDPLVNENHAISFGWATREQLDEMRLLTFRINDVLTDIFDKAGMILVDAKYEFGIGSDGKIYLGDEVSPDSCRIWDKETQEPLDKDRFRQDLGNVVGSYKHIAELLGAVTKK
jgi:phosphoribosylaminoimidazole-succinocarboxamide synthase